MRLLVALLVIVYLVGVGVQLSPTIEAKWSSATTPELVASIAEALPAAAAWPARAYRTVVDRRPTSPG
jgi:hypothetical protein